jgi:hypothetical protein
MALHNRDARQRLYRPPCAVPAALRQARGNNSGGRCEAMRSTLQGYNIRFETTWLNKP